jgi:hypothetical protein
MWIDVFCVTAKYSCYSTYVDTGGKFVAGIVDTGGNFATGINNTSDTSGKIPDFAP